ncbi:MAG: alpha-ketoglutarate-dependent dioxygenase AlkB [Akkermansiaceae bacterium]|nr:alpha-ketoglutarate-dependent dioxygenase AlkB [Akkermansiaceae bacterium]
MELFGADPAANLLPCDGEAFYHGSVFSPAECAGLLEALLRDIPWQHDETVMFGKRIITARKVAWFADGGMPYSYSGTTKQALGWSELLLGLKKVAEEKTRADYNSCLLNLYHGGDEGMGWHSDDEKEIASGSSIASLSFGAERKFSFKHKETKTTVSVMLADGSLLDMRGETQRCWLHQLPKTKKVTTPRVNLTFRKVFV